MTLYDDGFYDQITEGSVRSARKVVPMFLDWISDSESFDIEIDSVIDFGCGTGAWLSVFKENGIENVLGIDGDYVDRNRLLIPPDSFLAHDLNRIKETVFVARYDLAMSLEVAEHLPESSADDFVDALCRASDVILFSAAVPGQNGVNHINEQWPSYWIPKFEALGYSCNDAFRFIFWHDEEIENWYRQNILVFTKNIKWWSNNDDPRSADVIHYNNWMGKI